MTSWQLRVRSRAMGGRHSIKCLTERLEAEGGSASVTRYNLLNGKASMTYIRQVYQGDRVLGIRRAPLVAADVYADGIDLSRSIIGTSEAAWTRGLNLELPVDRLSIAEWGGSEEDTVRSEVCLNVTSTRGLVNVIKLTKVSPILHCLSYLDAASVSNCSQIVPRYLQYRLCRVWRGERRQYEKEKSLTQQFTFSLTKLPRCLSSKPQNKMVQCMIFFNHGKVKPASACRRAGDCRREGILLLTV